MGHIVDTAIRLRDLSAGGRLRELGAAAVGAVLVLAAGGCTGSGDDEAASDPRPTPVTESVTPGPTSPAPPPSAVALSATPTPRTDLADGRHPAYLERVDAAHRRLSVDVIQFFIGNAATEAAKEDHAPEVPPPNDIWIRNANSRLRTLTVAANAPITVNTLGAAESGSSVKDIQWPLAKLATAPNVDKAVFWLTVSDGVVTRIAEQYIP